MNSSLIVSLTSVCDLFLVYRFNWTTVTAAGAVRMYYEFSHNPAAVGSGLALTWRAELQVCAVG